MAKKAKKSARRKPASRKTASRRSGGGRSASRSKRAAPSAAGTGRVPGAPAGMHTVTAQITLRDSARAIEFYKQIRGFSFDAVWGKRCDWTQYWLLTALLIACTFVLTWAMDRVYRRAWASYGALVEQKA